MGQKSEIYRMGNVIYGQI